MILYARVTIIISVLEQPKRHMIEIKSNFGKMNHCFLSVYQLLWAASIV